MQRAQKSFDGCELLSICDLTIFDTPNLKWSKNTYKLWIAFNLWFDDLWHTRSTSADRVPGVVNCFQFVIWRSLTHPAIWAVAGHLGCELLSICDLTIFDTPKRWLILFGGVLWIAFNLWFDDLWHTFTGVNSMAHSVVNCFQFVIWRSLTHPSVIRTSVAVGCELLSICDLTIFDTPRPHHWCRSLQLWIAFNLWFDDLWHTRSHKWGQIWTVVNCFQFVIWRSLTHRQDATK